MRTVLPRTWRSAATLAAAAAAFGLFGAAPAQASPSPIPALSGTEKALLGSDAPKAVQLDPATGAILSVRALPETPEQGIGHHNYCNSGDGCFLSGRVPYAHQGFYGSAGTSRGNWPYRSGYNTGRYTASACWVQACAQRALPPNTRADFGGTLVTGTSFRIH